MRLREPRKSRARRRCGRGKAAIRAVDVQPQLLARTERDQLREEKATATRMPAGIRLLVADGARMNWWGPGGTINHREEMDSIHPVVWVADEENARDYYDPHEWPLGSLACLTLADIRHPDDNGLLRIKSNQPATGMNVWWGRQRFIAEAGNHTFNPLAQRLTRIVPVRLLVGPDEIEADLVAKGLAARPTLASFDILAA